MGGTRAECATQGLLVDLTRTMTMTEPEYTFTFTGEELAVVVASLVLSHRVTEEGIERHDPGLSGESGAKAILLLGDLLNRLVSVFPEPEE
jgi:hypothetical protein